MSRLKEFEEKVNLLKVKEANDIVYKIIMLEEIARSLAIIADHINNLSQPSHGTGIDGGMLNTYQKKEGDAE